MCGFFGLHSYEYDKNEKIIASKKSLKIINISHALLARYRLLEPAFVDSNPTAPANFLSFY